ncbi:MAG: exodeoxyribonuclease VII small subunit [Firmicutes bacterium]|nr:exodeoxyribonuclease VII small subunit [Bacillota bacterium]
MVVDKKTFAAGLTRLEEIVKKLEQGDLTLEEALALFEEGIGLTRTCNEKLEEAEGKIKLLMEKDGTFELQTWNEDGGQ